MSQNVEVLRRGYDAFARGDIPAVLELLDPEIEWHVPASLPIGGVYRGHEGVVGFFQSLPPLVQNLAVSPESFVDGGDTVVVLGTDSGEAAGGAYSVRFAHVWSFRNGKPVRFEELTDTAVLAQALQPAAAAV